MLKLNWIEKKNLKLQDVNIYKLNKNVLIIILATKDWK